MKEISLEQFVEKAEHQIKENDELLKQIQRLKKATIKYLTNLNELYDIEDEKRKYFLDLRKIATDTQEHNLDTKFYIERNGVLTYR